MKIYQVICVASFFGKKGGTPVIGVEEFKTFKEAQNYIIQHIGQTQDKLRTEMESSPEDESIRAEVTYGNGLLTYKLNVVTVNLLDEFCLKEAKFRLTDRFGIPEESISDNLLEDTATAVNEAFENCDFYDCIDNNIRTTLKKYQEEQEEE